MATSLLPDLLSHLTFLPQPAADFLPTLYETATSTVLAFLSLSSRGGETNSTTWAGAANEAWATAVRVHPTLFGFGDGLIGHLCFFFRVLAYICIGPFAFLILLDLCGYVIARTLHIPSQRVRVRMALNKARSETLSSPEISTSQPPTIVETTSSGISTAINIHPSKTPSSTEDREALLRTLSSSSSSSSVSSGFGVGVERHERAESSSSSSSSGALGLEGTGLTLGPVIGGGGVSSGAKQNVKSRRVPKSLSITAIPPSEPVVSINSYPSPSPGSSSSATSSRSSSPSRYMTTPGERHAVLPPSRDRSPSPTSIPLPPDDLDGDAGMERRRRRAASIGVEGALGLNDDEDSDTEGEYDEEVDGDEKSGALRRRRGTIRPTQRGT